MVPSNRHRNLLDLGGGGDRVSIIIIRLNVVHKARHCHK